MTTGPQPQRPGRGPGPVTGHLTEGVSSSAKLRIEDYALIGDLRTAALVGRDGSIDWLSLPRFDAPAVFAALLGDERNGHWALAPVNRQHCTRRHYRKDSLVLESEWTTAEGAVRVVDLMDPTSPHSQVVRIVEGLVGSVQMHMTLLPRMDYGKTVPALSTTAAAESAIAGVDALWLRTDVPVTAMDGGWVSDFTIEAGLQVTFTLTHTPADRSVVPVTDPAASLVATDNFWTQWAARSTYSGPWAEDVTRSLIMLKALTYAPSGGILAAATTSLPEQIGGSRNWDYRFSWLRDASFTAQAFLATGYVEEAHAWKDWLLRAVQGDPEQIQIMYGIDGENRLPEQTLDWLPGYAGSSPVRIGNEAASQQQNDVWGEVLDALDTAREAAPAQTPPDEAEAQLIGALLAQLERSWAEPDNGMWEVRGPRRHFVHSKVMAWVGVDRAVRAIEAGHADGEVERLRALRDTIHAEVTTRGFSPSLRAFTQSYASTRLDASVLLMPRYGFLPWTDPRMVETVDTIQRELTQHGFVRRYAVSNDGPNVDGVHGDEGVFLACSFWLADALHGIGRSDEAAELFERLLSLRNDVGILSEEYDPVTGRHLGNTPQAFSHAGVVTTALSLSADAALTASTETEESPAATG